MHYSNQIRLLIASTFAAVTLLAALSAGATTSTSANETRILRADVVTTKVLTDSGNCDAALIRSQSDKDPS